ncbi:unnamed protein product [Pieris macdunnoughi]|uniref:Uncharacterized protein n=1 Tax=Pieris macdunnoughi TaxID=345717 RepID=A0A821UI48_9NEOP|nr:unnamed protein product [Pieris macdunnoughi]
MTNAAAVVVHATANFVGVMANDWDSRSALDRLTSRTGYDSNRFKHRCFSERIAIPMGYHGYAVKKYLLTPLADPQTAATMKAKYEQEMWWKEHLEGGKGLPA